MVAGLSLRMRRVALGSVVAGAAWLGCASMASAATLCVQMPAPTACAATYTTLQGAIDAADIAYPGRDTIRIGPVTLPPEAAEAFTANPVDIVGSGSASTLLQSPPASPSDPALTIDGTSTVSDLGILIKDVPGVFSFESGLDLGTGTSGRRIAVTSETGMDNAAGVHVREGSALRDSSVTLPLGLANTAISASPGAVLEDLSLFAEVGVDFRDSGDPVVIRRIRTTAPVQEAIRVGGGGVLDISDSLLLIRDDSSATGLGTAGSTSATLTARNVTVVGSGEGIGAEVDVGGGVIDLRDSSLTGMSTSLSRWGTGIPTINVSYSNFNPATFDETGATEGGSIIQGAGNLNLAPLFVGVGDYRLSAASPLIDRGFPGAGPSALDLARAPRVTDGDGDGVARRDIGAYEYQPPVVQPPLVDRVAPQILALSLSRKKFRVGAKPTARVAAKPKGKRKLAPAGTQVRYRLSEAATVRFTVERILPGRRTRVSGRVRCVKPTRKLARAGAKRCDRYKPVRRGTLTRTGAAGKNSFPFTGRIGKKKLPAAKYRFRAVPTDAAGNTPKRFWPTAFRILRR